MVRIVEDDPFMNVMDIMYVWALAMKINPFSCDTFSNGPEIIENCIIMKTNNEEKKKKHNNIEHLENQFGLYLVCQFYIDFTMFCFNCVPFFFFCNEFIFFVFASIYFTFFPLLLGASFDFFFSKCWLRYWMTCVSFCRFSTFTIRPMSK